MQERELVLSFYEQNDIWEWTERYARFPPANRERRDEDADDVAKENGNAMSTESGKSKGRPEDEEDNE